MKKYLVADGKKTCHFSILLIEENQTVVNMLQQFLRALNYQVDCLTAFKKIEHAAQQTRYELVLLDIDFADGAGLHIIPLLQDLQPEARIVTMTAHNPKEIEQQVRAYRVFYHLIKPFSYMELSQIIECIVSRNKAKRNKPPPRLKAVTLPT